MEEPVSRVSNTILANKVHVKMEEPVSRVSNTILATVSVNKVSQENIARKVIHMSESFLYIQGKSTGNVV